MLDQIKESAEWIIGALVALSGAGLAWWRASTKRQRDLLDIVVYDARSQVEQATEAKERLNEARERAHRVEMAHRDDTIQRQSIQMDYLLEALTRMEREDDPTQRARIMDRAMRRCLAQRPRPDDEHGYTLDEVSSAVEDTNPI